MTTLPANAVAAPPAAARGSPPRALLALLAVALLVRVLATVLYGGAIDSEGAEYARLAENLLHGRAYEGIGSPGRQLVFAPLFPALIAAASLVTSDFHSGGRLVSILMGTLLVLPVFLLAQALYGRRAAWVAASLAALHPFLIYYSITVHCEPAYLAIFFLGLHWALRALRTQALRPFLLAGLCFGLGYLIRPEALVISFAVAAAALLHGCVARQTPLPRLALRAACMPALSLALASPYIVWFHGQTGQWRLEGKAPVNITTRLQMLDGASQKEASVGIDDRLNETGVWIQPHLATIRAFAAAPPSTASYVARQAGAVARFLKNEAIRARIFGTPALLLLAVVGFLRIRRERDFVFAQLVFLGIVALGCFGLFFIYFYDHRFLLVPFVLALLWAGEGCVALAGWLAARLKAPARGAAVLLVALAATIPALAVPPVRRNLADMKNSLALKTAGEWLHRHDPGAKIVMTSSTPLVFAANAEWVPFPYTRSGDVALRYLDKRQVNYLVLAATLDSDEIPYLKEWQSAFPNARAAEIYRVQAPIPLAIFALKPAGR